MNKTSFINFELLVRLAYWTILLYVLYEIGSALFADEYGGAVLYVLLLCGLVFTDVLYRVSQKVNKLAGIAERLEVVLPMVGKSMDFTSAQIVDTNRLVMQRLVSDEEKSAMIDLTLEVYGPEAADKLEKYLLIGPLESIKLDHERRQKEEKRSRRRTDEYPRF